MELRELANRVLFSNSLEEKLTRPDTILTDTDPGGGLTTPDAPSRPEALAFHRGERPVFPGMTQLDSNEDRAALLHFFANHELLATELMALALLKFPDAPSAFRMGLAETLQEEQMHTHLYMNRMRQCGLEFGQLPVNGFFWKNIASMETPVDYVSRLSLTFEQANLDYAHHYAGLFADLGDPKTSSILQKIYEDEIGHVSYGLKWFRHWKSEGSSEWEAYRGQLSFPLSPARAKAGFFFNREARRRAGLEETFIDQLEVYSQSRGRTPNIFFFNPEAETLLGSPHPKESARNDKTLSALAHDLAPLLFLLARRDDVAILPSRPAHSFLRKWQNAGLTLPEIQVADAVNLEGRKLAALKPWAWTPESAAFLEPFRDQCKVDPTFWKADWRSLFSKNTSFKWYGHFFSDLAKGKHEALPLLLPPSEAGKICSDETTLEKALHSIHETFPTAVVKAPFSSSGRGLFLIHRGECLSRRTHRLLEDHGSVLIQPWFERILDFSLQYEISLEGKTRFLGLVHLHNDARGRFKACSLEKDMIGNAAGDRERRLFYHPALSSLFQENLADHLGATLYQSGFSGPFGVDAMLVRNAAGEPACHPLVEINPRTTMGRVTLELHRHARKGNRTEFRILTQRDMDKKGFASFSDYVEQREREAPLKIDGNGKKTCVTSGFLPLNDPDGVQQFLPVAEFG